MLFHVRSSFMCKVIQQPQLLIMKLGFCCQVIQCNGIQIQQIVLTRYECGF